ncbi:hypothetical protein OKW39_001919 [Paraburkholderia sp. MM6662-R1]
MASAGMSLRLMVEHWLAPDPSTTVRVTKFRNRRSKHECYVCVETFRGACPVCNVLFSSPRRHMAHIPAQSRTAGDARHLKLAILAFHCIFAPGRIRFTPAFCRL